MATSRWDHQSRPAGGESAIANSALDADPAMDFKEKVRSEVRRTAYERYGTVQAYLEAAAAIHVQETDAARELRDQMIGHYEKRIEKTLELLRDYGADTRRAAIAALSGDTPEETP